MLNFIIWYFTLTLLGLLTFPLTYRLFPKFADRGYSLARTAGLLIWAYAFWMLASLGIAQNDVGGILLGLAVLAGLSLWVGTQFNKGGKSTGERLGEITQWVREHLNLILSVEILFLFAFAFIAIIRAANPEALGTEKPMELAFINAILRSPTFPPRDPWLSGYAISYYHFGYIITAMIAKITATAGSVAFNLMLGLVFALSAIGAYGVLYNLLANRKGATGNAFLAPLFLLLVSNFEGFLELLHQKGIFWNNKSQNFWIWLDMQELSRDPATVGDIPDRFWWWWRASRVIQDYDLLGNHREIIDEFPFFSYLLGDLHPHVLIMPFMLLAVVVGLNIFLGGWRGETKLFGYHFRIAPFGLFSVALLLGGIAFLNTWDILIAAALIASAYVLARVRENGWSWLRLEDFIFFGFITGIGGFLLYLPFYIGFSSQAGGILPNLINPTRGAHLWVMFGTLFIPIFFWMIHLWRSEKRKPDWALGFALALGLPLFLWLLSWLSAWTVTLLNENLAMTLIRFQGMETLQEVFIAANSRRELYIGGAITLFLLLGGAFSLLLRQDTYGDNEEIATGMPTRSFILLLIALGGLLVLAPEYLYLRDQFGTRMNTIFKFYYQAWLLWSLAAAYGAIILLQNTRRIWNWVNTILVSFVIVAGLVYPLYGVLGKTNGFKPIEWTLDSAAHITRNTPDEAAAIAWLKTAPDGVILEAVGGSYSGYARISTNTGLPTVLGWPGHESQWRGGYEEMGSRQSDIETIYTATDWVTTKTLLDQYEVDYIYVGTLERTTYTVSERKFQRYLELVFSDGMVNIYAVP
jgi:YYY domain-containing protein